MPHSHHSHSGQFCKHGSGSLEDVVIEAIRQGFEVYGLTEHVPRYRPVDLYPEEDGLSIEALISQFDDFVGEAHRLKRLYASQIILLVGLETEFITNEDLDALDLLLRRHQDQLEYIVGSVHHVHSIPIDFDFSTFEKALDSFDTGGDTQNKTEAFFTSYFDAQYEVLCHFKPEIIGHFDLCRLYTPGLQFVDYPEAWSRIQRNIKYAVEYGALFEISAAAFRKNWESAYPKKDVIELISEFGGRFALSDDSHGPHAVGLNYNRMENYLRSVGISEIWHLQASRTPNAGGRIMQPVRLPGEWWNHPYWKIGTS